MKGWKTWAAGISSILIGLGMFGKMAADGDFSSTTEAFGFITGGFAVLGIGHKIEKAGGEKEAPTSDTVEG